MQRLATYTLLVFALLLTLVNTQGVIIDQIISSQPVVFATDVNPVQTNNITDPSEEFCGTERSLTARMERPDGVNEDLRISCFIGDGTFALSSDIGRRGSCMVTYSDDGADFSEPKDFSACDKWLVRFASTDNPVELIFTARTASETLRSGIRFDRGDASLDACADFVVRSSTLTDVLGISVELTGQNNADAEIDYICCVPAVACYHEVSESSNFLIAGVDTLKVTVTCENFLKRPVGKEANIDVSYIVPSIASLAVDTVTCSSAATPLFADNRISSREFGAAMVLLPGQTGSCTFDMTLPAPGDGVVQFDILNTDTFSASTSTEGASRVGTVDLCKPTVPTNFIVNPSIVGPSNCPPFTFADFAIGTWRVGDHPKGLLFDTGVAPAYCLRGDGFETNELFAVFSCNDSRVDGLYFTTDGVDRMRVFGEVIGGRVENGAYVDPYILAVDITYTGFNFVPPNTNATQLESARNSQGRGRGEWLRLETVNKTSLLYGIGYPSLIIKDNFNGFTALATMTGWLKFSGIPGRGDFVATIGECVNPMFSLNDTFPPYVDRIPPLSFLDIITTDPVVPYGKWHLKNTNGNSCLSFGCITDHDCLDLELSCKQDTTYADYSGTSPGMFHIAGDFLTVIENKLGPKRVPVDITFVGCTETTEDDFEQRTLRCPVVPGASIGTINNKAVYQTTEFVLTPTYEPGYSVSFEAGLNCQDAPSTFKIQATFGEEVL